ncbi:hypothetical protein Nepgr_004328 [Nepenthes gracilis]|uniref:RecA-like N-terminal domain-containing protein n=1 Tax=Nepenthes gracilis TaxID=150966 RepID=A0AAD3XEY6_NEPGR|nr:hypothetical protein Nepgr_004328 [Nepenthes gracilis]
MFLEEEHAFDVAYSKPLGVDVKNLIIYQPNKGEVALELADCLCQSGAIHQICADSISTLTPRARNRGVSKPGCILTCAEVMDIVARNGHGIAIGIRDWVKEEIVDRNTPERPILCAMRLRRIGQVSSSYTGHLSQALQYQEQDLFEEEIPKATRTPQPIAIVLAMLDDTSIFVDQTTSMRYQCCS